MDSEGLVPSVCLKDEDKTTQHASLSVEETDKTVEDPNSMCE